MPHRFGSTARFCSTIALVLGLLLAPFAASPVRAQETLWTPPVPAAVTASAVYAIDITRGLPLYALNAEERLPMGSTAKIATALTVMAYAEPDETVTIDASDPVSDPTVYSNMGLQPGMVFTVEELLYGLLIPSGNDAAAALPRHVGARLPGGDADPRAAFMTALNALAASLGAANTRFATPDGLEGEGAHYTTARDLAILATALLNDPLLATIVGTPDVTLTSRGSDGSELYVMNTNRLLGVDDSVIGVKTGSTVPAGGCLVIATREGENTVITVILGSDLEYGGETGYLVDERWNDIDTVLRGIEQNYAWVDLGDSARLAGLEAELAAWNVTLKSNGAIAMPVGQGDLRYRLELGPAGEPDSVVGRVLFFAGSTLVADLPVYQRAA